MKREELLRKKAEMNLSLGARVYRDLKKAIVNSEFSPGQYLHEEYLTELTGASRTPIREALLHLQRDGLVELIPRRGVRVWNLEELRITELLSMQLLYEGIFFDVACISDTSESVFAEMLFDMQELSDIILKTDPESEEWRKRRREYSELSFNFHRFLVKCLNNKSLLDAYDLMMAKVKMYFNFTLLQNSPFFQCCSKDHQGIIEAILEKNFHVAKMLHSNHLRRASLGKVAVNKS